MQRTSFNRDLILIINSVISSLIHSIVKNNNRSIQWPDIHFSHQLKKSSKTYTFFRFKLQRFKFRCLRLKSFAKDFYVKGLFQDPEVQYNEDYFHSGKLFRDEGKYINKCKIHFWFTWDIHRILNIGCCQTPSRSELR